MSTFCKCAINFRPCPEKIGLCKSFSTFKVHRAVGSRVIRLPLQSAQRVQRLPREAENLTAHNSGYVYICRTPFDADGPDARRIHRSKWRTGNQWFIFDPPEPPGCLPPTCLDLFRQQQNPTLDRNLH